MLLREVTPPLKLHPVVAGIKLLVRGGGWFAIVFVQDAHADFPVVATADGNLNTAVVHGGVGTERLK